MKSEKDTTSAMIASTEFVDSRPTYDTSKSKLPKECCLSLYKYHGWGLRYMVLFEYNQQVLIKHCVQFQSVLIRHVRWLPQEAAGGQLHCSLVASTDVRSYTRKYFPSGVNVALKHGGSEHHTCVQFMLSCLPCRRLEFVSWLDLVSDFVGSKIYWPCSEVARYSTMALEFCTSFDDCRGFLNETFFPMVRRLNIR